MGIYPAASTAAASSRTLRPLFAEDAGVASHVRTKNSATAVAGRPIVITTGSKVLPDADGHPTVTVILDKERQALSFLAIHSMSSSASLGPRPELISRSAAFWLGAT